MRIILQCHRPQEDAHCQWKAVYKYFNIVLDGLQGLIVSVAFCYRNGEVGIGALPATPDGLPLVCSMCAKKCCGTDRTVLVYLGAIKENFN